MRCRQRHHARLRIYWQNYRAREVLLCRIACSNAVPSQL